MKKFTFKVFDLGAEIEQDRHELSRFRNNLIEDDKPKTTTTTTTTTTTKKRPIEEEKTFAFNVDDDEILDLTQNRASTPQIVNEKSSDPDDDVDDKLIARKKAEAAAAAAAASKKKSAKRRKVSEPTIVASSSSSSSQPQSMPVRVAIEDDLEEKPINDVAEQKEQPEEDAEEEVRLYMYKSGAHAKIKSSTMVRVFRAAFQKNKIRWVNSLTNLPNSVGTVYCVFDDKKKERAMREVTQDAGLLKVCMAGRLRMTPLSNLLGVLEQSDYTSFDLAVLRMCSYMCRPKVEKFVSLFDTEPRVSSQWRIPSTSIRLSPSVTVINNKSKFDAYLLDQMFPYRSEEKD